MGWFGCVFFFFNTFALIIISFVHHLLRSFSFCFFITTVITEEISFVNHGGSAISINKFWYSFFTLFLFLFFLFCCFLIPTSYQILRLCHFCLGSSIFFGKALTFFFLFLQQFLFFLQSLEFCMFSLN